MQVGNVGRIREKQGVAECFTGIASIFYNSTVNAQHEFFYLFYDTDIIH